MKTCPALLRCPRNAEFCADCADSLSPMKKTQPEKPLFVPLKTRFYREFQNGIKSVEYRPEGPQWNSKVCRVGRAVVLSNGYGKQERMTGKIVSYQSEPVAAFVSGWVDCYGQKKGPVACIGIQINRP